MKISVHVCRECGEGWDHYEGEVPDGSDIECYALPKEACRAEFWSRKLGTHIEPGSALIWNVQVQYR